MNPAEEYILSKDDLKRAILLHLMSVIEAVVPDVSMKFKWRIPCFYVYHAPICYLNAPEKKAYVDLVFWNSAHLTKHLDKMTQDNRKVVRSLRYTSLQEIDDTVLTEVLLEAYAKRSKGFYK